MENMCCLITLRHLNVMGKLASKNWADKNSIPIYQSAHTSDPKMQLEQSTFMENDIYQESTYQTL